MQNHSHFSQFNLPQSQGVSQNILTSNKSQSAVVHPSTISTQILSHRSPFIEQPQYIATIPVQPFTAASEYVLSSAQNQIQDHLQRKHEELQKIIIEQQNELRRVSEQLFMARYGIVPSIVNVSVPHLVVGSEVSESGRCMGGSSAYQEHQQQLENQSQFEVNQSTNTFQQHDDFELIPFQMNHQAQILFSSQSNEKESNVSK